MQHQKMNLDAITDDDYLVRNVKHMLPVPLDMSEIAGLAKARAAEENKLAQLKQDLADKRKEFAERIDELEKSIAQMGADIDRETQDRVVMCDLIFKGGVIHTVRQDNGVVFITRAATQAEAQRHLPAVEGNSGILADAARAQKASNSEEDEEGDVIPGEGDGERAPKRRKKAKAAE